MNEADKKLMRDLVRVSPGPATRLTLHRWPTQDEMARLDIVAPQIAADIRADRASVGEPGIILIDPSPEAISRLKALRERQG